jgi:two-component system, LytTR family, sensor kinase
MDKIKKYSFWIIIVSAIIVTILFNIRSFSHVKEMLELNKFREMPEKGMIRVYFLIFTSVFQFLTFSIFAFLNFTWKEKVVNLDYTRSFKTFLIIVCNIFIYSLIIIIEFTISNFYFDFRRHMSTDFFIFANIAVASMAIAEAYFLILLGKAKISELENISLREDKTNAELAALKEQISPHFFFNTLSSLSTIVRNEKKEVGLEFIQDMSKIYRYSLSSGQQDLVNLKEELDFIHSYVFLLKKRFYKKLIINIDIPEQYFQWKIPPMSLQLLVENAIQHNLITQASPLSINIFIKNNMICVENNLQKKETTESFGIGLENLANRYRLLAQKVIFIEKDELIFSVSLPLI